MSWLTSQQRPYMKADPKSHTACGHRGSDPRKLAVTAAVLKAACKDVWCGGTAGVVCHVAHFLADLRKSKDDGKNTYLCGLGRLGCVKPLLYPVYICNTVQCNGSDLRGDRT